MLTLIVLCVIVLLIYIFFTRNHNYWNKKGVKHDKPVPVFGTHFESFFGYRPLTEKTTELYKRHKNEKYFGYYIGNFPELYLRDPDLIRQVLAVDFSTFYNRGLGRNPENEPLMHNLFTVEGDSWKLLRQRLTPAFTTSKLKNMFPLIIECTKRFEKLVEEYATMEECNVKDLMSRFTIDFIGVCAFGVEMDCINNDDSPFMKIGHIIFEPSLRINLINKLLELYPELSVIFTGTDKKLEQFMGDVFTTISKQRNYKPIGRNDFIDILLELSAQGTIEGLSIENKNSDGTPKKISMEFNAVHMIAQIFIFFGAGFETSSFATSHLLHQLALNPDKQRKVQEDIDSTLARFDNQLCYDAVAEMHYLEMAFKEALRILPSVTIINRVCAQKYTFPGTDLTIEAGTKIAIPVQAIQNDEKYFDSPSEFRPERFLAEEEQKRHKFVYLPFGEGSRMCIGARLGRMQSLAGLAAVLHKFSFEPSQSTTTNMKFNAWSNFINIPEQGFPLKISRRKDRN